MSSSSPETTVRVDEHSCAIELRFGLLSSGCKVRCPKRIDRLLALGLESDKFSAFETAKADRYALRRETMLIAKTRGELARACRTRQFARRDKTIGAVVFEKVTDDDETPDASLGQGSNLLPGNVECAEDVGSGLVWIERCGPGDELRLGSPPKAAQVSVVCLTPGWSRETQDASADIVGRVPGDGDNNQTIPTLQVSNLIVYCIERRLLRPRRDAEAGIDDLNGCLRRAVRTCGQQKE